MGTKAIWRQIISAISGAWFAHQFFAYDWWEKAEFLIHCEPTTRIGGAPSDLQVNKGADGQNGLNALRVRDRMWLVWGHENEQRSILWRNTYYAQTMISSFWGAIWEALAKIQYSFLSSIHTSQVVFLG